jgi:hypothetical protein
MMVALSQRSDAPMNRTRRQFMQVCAAAIGASAGSQPVPGSSSPAAAQDSLTNWAGNYRYSTSRLYHRR